MHLPLASDRVVQAATGLELIGQRYLVVSVKATPDQTELDHVLHAVGAGLAAGASPARGVFLCLSDQGDYGLGPSASDAVLASRVDRSYLGGGGSVVGPGLDPRVAKTIAARAAGVIAMRLHAQIFAVSTGVPLLGICFERKTTSYLQRNGLVPVDAAALQGTAVAAWLDGLGGCSPDTDGAPPEGSPERSLRTGR